MGDPGSEIDYTSAAAGMKIIKSKEINTRKERLFK